MPLTVISHTFRIKNVILKLVMTTTAISYFISLNMKCSVIYHTLRIKKHDFKTDYEYIWVAFNLILYFISINMNYSISHHTKTKQNDFKTVHELFCQHPLSYIFMIMK